MSWEPGEIPRGDSRYTDPIAYYVQLSGESGRIVRTTDTTISILGLRNGVPYTFRVYSATLAGRSPAAGPVTATPTTGAEGVVAGVIVQFADSVHVTPGSPMVPGDDRVTTVDLSVAEKVTEDSVLVEFSEPVDLATAEQIASDLAADELVEWAEPDQFLFTASSAASTDWNLSGTYGVDATEVEDRDTAGAGVTVAVIDTGITDHPELNANLVSGYDFVSSPEQLMATRQPNAPPVAFDADSQNTTTFGAVGRDSNPADPGDWRETAPIRSSSWHGTKMAGLINSVAPGASIQPIRALSWRGGLLSDIAASITWAAGGEIDGVPANANPSKVINMSFAVEAMCPTALQQAIDSARERGSILIAAAGNANDDAAKYAPGNCNGVITVGSTTNEGVRADYSNYGSTVDIAAPGGDTTTPVLTASNTGSTTPDQPTRAGDFGTSVSAAHVAAGAAILAARNTTITPDDAYAALTGRDSVKAFANPTCDTNPDYSCGTGIFTLAQIATISSGDQDFAMTFNGTSQGSMASSSSAFDITGAITLQAWVNPTSCTTTDRFIISKDDSYQFACRSGTYQLALNAGIYGWVNTGVSALLNQWQHVAVVRAAGSTSFSLYLNGQLAFNGGTVGTGAIGTNSNVLSVGSSSSSSFYFPGQIDQVKVYNAALDAAAIATDMHTYAMYSGGSVTSANHIAFYDFNEGPAGTTGTGTVYNRASGATSATNLRTVNGPTYTDIKQTTSNGNNTVVTFPRSYLNAAGGWRPPSTASSIGTLVVGGGGGGGGKGARSQWSGGGGAGGEVKSESLSVTSSPLAVTVGVGGVGGSGSSYLSAGEGTDSVLGSVTSKGGGRGGSAPLDNGSPLVNGPTGTATGGGGSAQSVAQSGATGTEFSGGAGNATAFESTQRGGGGAGAGQAGFAGSLTTNGGRGGDGVLSSITGSSLRYGGGGGGGTFSATPGAAGSGGGGAGRSGTSTGNNGTDGLGGGGGGAGAQSTAGGGRGGSGVVIVSYSTAASGTCAPESTQYVSNGTTFRVVAFKNTGESACSWTVPAGVTSVDYVAVGGGGGGGMSHGGGGGAGGLRQGTGLVVTPGVQLSVTVGAGGSGPSSSSFAGSSGASSGIAGGASTISVAGGGGGGSSFANVAGSGGSGGGAARSSDTIGTGTAGQGNNGALGANGGTGTGCFLGGGGGGAIGTGGAANGSTCTTGAGGVGASVSWLPVSVASTVAVGEVVTTGGTSAVFFAGGGAGGAFEGVPVIGSPGGNGGGGATVSNSGPQAESGLANTGGGGGGAGSGQATASGGSGVVVLRYMQSAAVGTCVPATTQYVSGATTYQVVAFKNTGSCTWTVPIGVTSVDYVVVAGGGGGGTDVGGGGGAGGLRTATTPVTAGATVTVLVGAGGAGAAGTMFADDNKRGTPGVGSSLTGGGLNIVAVGGGGGGSGGNDPSSFPGINGGSGGGAVLSSGFGTGTSGEGNDGGVGNSTHPTYRAGGGGGAGERGGTAELTSGGFGGVGKNTNTNFTWLSGSTANSLDIGEVSGQAVYFASGGGGGGTTPTSGVADTGGVSGLGGGGDGSASGFGLDASEWTGGGGGGGGRINANEDDLTTVNGGAGGSGVVVLQYVQPVSTVCTPTQYSYTSGGTPYTVVEFQGSGTCNWTVPSGVTAVDALVVGGGGGGGAWIGGGGGGGGVTSASNRAVTPASNIDITLGQGGSGAFRGSTTGVNGSNGGQSSIGTPTMVTAPGGGVGASWTSQAAGSGASVATGGGGSQVSGTYAGGTGTGTGSSLTGGSAAESAQPHAVGGGAGAGGNGASGSGTGSSSTAGSGGIGLSSDISGAGVFYGGGGGGSAHGAWATSTSLTYSIVPGVGGLGGGGVGGQVTTATSGTAVIGSDGLDGLGGGGGGAANMSASGTTYSSRGGSGGDGVVLVRYSTNWLSLSVDGAQAPSGYTFGTGWTSAAPKVQLIDSAGNSLTTLGVSVTASFTATSGSSTLSGATVQTDADGVADFSSLVLDGDAGTAGTLTFAATGYGSVTSASFSIAQATPTFTWSDVSKTYGDSAYTIAAPTPSTPGAFTYASSNTSVISIATATATVVGAGSATITATFTPTDTTNYVSGGTTTQTVTVVARPITLTSSSPSVAFGVAVAPTVSLTSGTLAGSDAISGGATFTYVGTGSTTYSSSTTPPTAVGTYSVTPSAAVFSTGNASNYNITYVAGTVTISQASQTITFGALGVKTFNDPAFTVSATASSTLAVTFASTTTSVCTVFGSTVTIIGAGACTIRASQAGNSSFAAAPDVDQTFTVNKANQAAFSINSSGTQVFGESISMTTSGGSAGAISYAVTTVGTALCSFSGSILTAAGPADSTCGITATRAGDDNYNPITATQTVTVAARPITLTSSSPSVAFDVAVAPTVSLTSGTLAGSDAISGGATFTYVGTGSTVYPSSTTTPTAVGTYSVTPSAAVFSTGNASNYNITYVAGTVTISKANQSTLSFVTTSATLGGTTTLATSGGSGSGVVSFSLDATGTASCSLSGAVLSYTSGGTCTISATKAADDSYNSATTGSVTFTVAGPSTTTSTIAVADASLVANGSSSTTVTVTLRDASGNVVSADAATVVISATTGTVGAVSYAGSGQYTASLTSPNTVGSATVSATLNSLSMTETATVTFTPGPLAAFGVTMSGGTNALSAASKVAGTAFNVRVSALDANNNLVTSFTGTVTLTSTAWVGSVSATISANGFVDSIAVTPTVANAGQYVAAASGVVATSQASSAFTVNPGTATQILVTRGPVGAQSGGLLATQPIAVITDAYANTVTSSTQVITASLQGAPGTGALTGTVAVAATSGQVQWSDLVYSGASGVSRFLEFTATGLTPAISTALSVTPGTAAASTSTITASSASINVGGAGSTITVQLKDAQGNTITTGGATVTMSSTLGSLGGVTDNNNGTYEATLSPGTTPGTATVSATVAGVTLTATTTVTIAVGVASTLAITTAAGDTTYGTDFSPQPVITVQDVGGNTVTTWPTSVTATVKNSNGDVVETATATPTSGVATFSGLGSDTPAGTLTVEYTSGALTLASETVVVSQVTVTVTASSPSVTYGDPVPTVTPSYLGFVNGQTSAVLTTNPICTTAYTNTSNAGTTPSTSCSGAIAANYSFSYVNGAVTIAKATPTFSWSNVSKTYGDAAYTITAPTPTVDGSFSYVSSDTSVLSIFVATATVVGAGSATVTATFTPTETTNFVSGGTVTQTVTVGKAVATVTAADQSVAFGTAASTVTGAGSVTYGLVNGDTSSVVSGSVSYTTTYTNMTNAGTVGVSITPVVTGLSADDYTFSAILGTVTITQDSQTITFAQPPAVIYGVTPFSLTPTSDSDLLVSLNSNSTAVCTVSDLAVTIVSAGTCSLTASQVGTINYSAAPNVTQTFTVNKSNQATLTVTSASTAIFGEAITLASSGGSGTGATAYAIDAGTCTVSGSTLTLGNATSLCQVSATKLGDSNYLPVTSAAQTITITRAGQTAAFTSLVPAAPQALDTYTPTATSLSDVTGLSSGITPTFTPSGACTLSGGVITFSAGTCTITAAAASNVNFDVSPSVTQVIEVGSINQNITFAQPTTKTFGSSSFALGATASSGLTVGYTLGSGITACSVSTLGVVTLLDTGTCQVIASQPGQVGVYAPASNVTRAFQVVAALPSAPTISSASASSQAITVGVTAPGFTGAPSETIAAYQVVATPVGAGSTVTSSSCTTSPCTITGLVNGTAYTVTVAAINTAGTGPASGATGSLTPATNAFAVGALAAVPGNNVVNVSWTQPTDLGGGSFIRYDLSYRVAGGTYGSAIAINSIGSTTYQVTGLNNGTSYDFKVVTITTANGSEISGNTAEVVQYPSTVPSVPRSLTVLAATATAVQFSWSAPLSNGGAALTTPNYTVTVTGSAGADPVTCAPTGVNTFCSASGLTNGASYVFSVVANNRMGSSIAATTTYAVPSADADLTNVLVTGTGGAVALSPIFASATLAYSATVANSVASVTVTPTTSSAGATVTVDGSAVTSASASTPIALSVGANEIEIVVTASDPRFTQTYTLSISRSPAPPTPSGGGGEEGVSPNIPVTPPANVVSGAAAGAVLVNGEVDTNVVLVKTSTNSGWEAVGTGFQLSVDTETASGAPESLTPAGVMQVPQGGRIVVNGDGYMPNTQVAVFAIPRTTERMGSKVLARAMTNAIYIASGTVNGAGVVSATMFVPQGMNLGDYVLQINGETVTAQLRSVNLLMNVISTPPSMRAGLVREAAFYQGKSVKLSDAGKQRLRSMVESIPVGAQDVSVVIVGVSVSLGTVAENIDLARDRAQGISSYLQKQGVAGEYTVTISTTFTVDAAERTMRSVMTDTMTKAELEKPAESSAGKPLSTATISFESPQST